MEQLFPRAALPLPPPHWFLPMLWDSLAPCPPSSYLGKVPLQNASPDQDFLEERLSPGTVWSHSQGTRECTGSPVLAKKLSLKEPRYVERGAVTLRIEAAAAGLDRRASSLCSSRIPALVTFSLKPEFMPRSLLQDVLVRFWIFMVVFAWVGHGFCAFTGRSDVKWCF